MEPSTLSQIHMAGFMALFILYWTLHRGIEHLLRRYGPESYRSAECSVIGSQSRRFLLSTVYMLLRGGFGVFFTFPSCLYAGVNSSWSVNEPFGHAGALCLASQAVPWISELPFQTDYNTELMLHHIFALLITCDFAFHPQYMPARLLYLYLAAHFGDGAAVVARILRNCGHQIQTSRSLWMSIFAMTNVHIWSKTGVVVWSVGRVFISPYRICDWFFPFCAFFFAVYTLQGAHKNLVYLGLTKPSEKGPRGLILWNGWWFSRFDMIVAVATITAVMLKPFMYAQALPYRMGAAEHAALWSESFASCALALVFIGVLTHLWATSWKATSGCDIQGRGALYVRLGAVAAAGLVLLKNIYEHLGSLKILDRGLVASWTAQTFPIWALFIRLGMWMSVGEEHRGTKTETKTLTETLNNDDENKQDGHVPDPKVEDALRARDKAEARRQLRGVLANALILSAPFIFNKDYSQQEWHHTTMLSCSALQVIDEVMSLTTRKDEAQLSQPLSAAITILGAGASFAAHKSACDPIRQPAMLRTAVSIAVVASIPGRLLLPIKHSSSGKAVTEMITNSTRRAKSRFLSSRPVRALRSRMDVLGSVVLVSVQLVGMWECYGTDRFSRALSHELGPGFENGKDVVASTPAVFGIIVSLMLSTIVAWLVW